MPSWKDRLHEADAALARELPPERARLLRQAAIAEVERATRHAAWSLPFALTAGSLTAAAVALVLSTAIAPPPQAAGVETAGAAEEMTAQPPQAGSNRQQLHFATPGGTRIIWVFDADFEVKGTLP